MTNCVRCGKEIESSSTVCPECQKNLRYTYGEQSHEGALIDSMVSYIKENSITGLIELVVQAIKRVDG